MGAVAPTRFSRVSFGWRDSARSLVDVDAGDTGTAVSWTQGAAGDTLSLTGALAGAGYTGTTLALTSTLSANGAATLQSTLTVRGQTTATGGIAVGGGANLVAVSTATAAISFGAIAALGTSSIQTVGLSGATRGDHISITPDALWPVVADNRLVTVYASSGSTTGEVNVWAANSAQSSITPTAASVFRLTRINFASYL